MSSNVKFSESKTESSVKSVDSNHTYVASIKDEELREVLEDMRQVEAQVNPANNYVPGSSLDLALVVGNTAKETGNGEMVEWTAFVAEKNRTKFLKHVEFHLHPTFSPNHLLGKFNSNSGGFEITRIGWGTFTLQIDLTDIFGNKHSLEHHLCFDETISERTVNVRVQCPSVSTKPLAGVEAPRRLMHAKPCAMHGVLGSELLSAKPPVMVRYCDAENRPGYETRKSHEYSEQPQTLRAKVKLLAQLLRRSQNCVAYTGAGISTASGIGDYASKAKDSLIRTGKRMKPKLRNWLQAEPTLAHRVMAALVKRNNVRGWVQQNHDGLPQKAGVPQDRLNEIHGAWFDPSNPVVPMTGTLRGDLMEDLLHWERKADLVLAMGSSLCGMNADRLVVTAGKRMAKANNSCLGSVIVSLQQTPHDTTAALRIFATIDSVMALLAEEMRLDVIPYRSVPGPSLYGVAKEDRVFRVPYDRHGQRTRVRADQVPWDLRPGATVRVTTGPGEGFEGTMGDRNSDGHFRVSLPLMREGACDHGSCMTVYVLGWWWVEAALRGGCATLPIVNMRPDTSQHSGGQMEVESDDDELIH